MRIISGQANPDLSEKIFKFIEKSYPMIKPISVPANFRKFSDGEIYVEIGDNVRGEEVYIIQPTMAPTNDNLMELLIMLDAVRRSSARRIVAVVPYYGYARQDRKTAPRSPITAKLVAKMIEAAGATRVVTIDLHAAQIQGFFEIPTDNLYAMPTLHDEIMNQFKNDDKMVVVSPDVGGVLRARAMAKRLDCELAIIDKRRPKAGESEVMNIIGDVKGLNCILIDDMCDSAGTLCNAANALIDIGKAKSVSAYVTHGVLSGGALERIENSQLQRVVITDTISAGETAKNHPKIKIVSVAKLLGEALARIYTNQSVSSLFN